jgi:hypothetical protein
MVFPTRQLFTSSSVAVIYCWQILLIRTLLISRYAEVEPLTLVQHCSLWFWLTRQKECLKFNLGKPGQLSEFPRYRRFSISPWVAFTFSAFGPQDTIFRHGRLISRFVLACVSSFKASRYFEARSVGPSLNVAVMIWWYLLSAQDVEIEIRALISELVCL